MNTYRRKQTAPHGSVGGLLGVLLGSVAAFVYYLTTLPMSARGVEGVLGIAAFLAVSALIGGLCTAVVLLWRQLPPVGLGLVVGATGAFVGGMYLVAMPVPGIVVLVVGLLLPMAILGALIGKLYEQRNRDAAPWERVLAWGLLVIGVAGGLACGLLVAGDGTDRHLIPYDSDHPVSADALGLDDLTAPGGIPVVVLSYGSGKDLRRARFGEGIDLGTSSADLTPFVDLEGMAPWRIRYRDRYWGFSLSEAPLNGLVWLPDTEESVPLVVFVHGNAPMHIPSEMGFAYLGEHLASRGYAVVSIDQNFLNMGGAAGDFFGAEVAGRAWHLLEHLKLLEKWNQQSGSPLYERLDLESIAIVGHSRGGEAAAAAVLFDNLSAYPEDASIGLDTNFRIRTVVAVAPTDRFYRPGERDLVLDGVDYLVLQGGHDGDIMAFLGQRQLHRTVLSEPERVRAAVYFYRANHGHFNTEWGPRDLGFPFSGLLNSAPVLEEDDQRRLFKAYVTGFLDASLQGQTERLALFQNQRIEAPWLPKDYAVKQFRTGAYSALAGFDEDHDPRTGTHPGIRLSADGLTAWSEVQPPMRLASHVESQVFAARIEWERAFDQTAPFFAVGMDPEYPVGAVLEECNALSMSLINETTDRFVDFSIEVVSETGETARVSLRDFEELAPKLPVQTTKLPLLERLLLLQAESVVQTVLVPLDAFERLNSDFSLAELSEIRFVFDRSTAGAVSLESLGFEYVAQWDAAAEDALEEELEE